MATPVVAQEDSGYQMPTDDEIRAIIASPEMIGEILEGASEEQVATILIKAVTIMESTNTPEETIAAKLNTMLNTISEVRGEAFGAAVMARIRKKVNPRLLPVVPPPGSPAGGSRYPRQSTP